MTYTIIKRPKPQKPPKHPCDLPSVNIYNRITDEYEPNYAWGYGTIIKCDQCGKRYTLKVNRGPSYYWARRYRWW